MESQNLKTLVWWAWAGFAANAVAALLSNALGWATWIGDLAVATGFACILPMLVNEITFGFTGRLFSRQRHQTWWLVAYVFALMTVCSRRLGLPDWAMMFFGALALVVAASILYSIATGRQAARRPGEN